MLIIIQELGCVLKFVQARMIPMVFLMVFMIVLVIIVLNPAFCIAFHPIHGLTGRLIVVKKDVQEMTIQLFRPTLKIEMVGA